MKKDVLFSEFPYIESEEIILSKIEEVNLEDLYEICANENLYKYKPGNAKKSIDTVKNMIAHFQRDFQKKKIIFLGVFLKSNPKKLLGIAEIFDIDEKVNVVTIGYTLNEDYFGKGIASNVVKTLIKYLFNEVELNRIQAYVMVENIKSQNVLKRNNFIKEGTIREGHIWTGKGIVNLELYSILKSEYIK
jgi:[ribosomal protein S5]-alanine N-acetyltransferase